MSAVIEDLERTQRMPVLTLERYSVVTIWSDYFAVQDNRGEIVGYFGDGAEACACAARLNAVNSLPCKS